MQQGLCINQLSVSVEERPILQEVSLSIAAGQVHALMGPNGSGKSSLAYAVMGHPRYTITGGTIALDGHDLTQLPTDKRARSGLFLALQQPPEIPGVRVRTFLREAWSALRGQESGGDFDQALRESCKVLAIKVDSPKQFS